jgi:putative membrane protein
MKKLLMTWVLNSVSLPIVAAIVNQFITNGMTFHDGAAAVSAGATLGAVNTFIRPVLKFFTFPLTFVTFGLFALLLNVACLMAVDWYLPNFQINGWISTLGGTVLLSFVSSALNTLFNRD